MNISSFPLTWPDGWKRTPLKRRRTSRFGKRSIATCVNLLIKELHIMGIPDHNVIISSNLRVKNNGMPYSGQPQTYDSGVSVWWKTRDGKRKVIALDTYINVEDTLYAITRTINAMRLIQRYGGSEILERTFTGFTALPHITETSPSWREILNYAGNNLDEAEHAYLSARAKAHPDKGGSAHQFRIIEEAWRACVAELGARAT